MHVEDLRFDAPLEAYARQAGDLLRALQSGSSDAAWMFKWEHPRFRGRSVTAVRPDDLTLDDARTVIARHHAHDTWSGLEAFANAVGHEGPVRRFESAVEAVVNGDLKALRSLLRADPALVRARSSRRHQATLLHYIAANGVEGTRQKTPPNAVEIARALLDAGAEADALAGMYDQQCTTLSMLVSSSPPARAGLQIALAELLLDSGAAIDGAGTNPQPAVLTALTFGFLDTARALAKRMVRHDLAIAAGLGWTEDAARLLPESDPHSRHVALALAAQLGHRHVVQLLLDAGGDPDRYNPDGFHAHTTPLHQAVWSGHEEVVRLLVERGARLDLRDRVYAGTPLGWAEYGRRDAIAEYLRGRGAPV